MYHNFISVLILSHSLRKTTHCLIHEIDSISKLNNNQLRGGFFIEINID